ncbi:MAG TPA: DUF3592 domain-containing protein [Rhizomicrobium sp.]|nr:DUF3592 domain-containing protein [Rhizomicrobium sp.]
MLILLGIFAPMLVLTAILYGMAGRIERRIEAARSWPRAPATITATRIGRSKNSHWPEVRYDYQVAGREYHGRRLEFVRRSRGKAECEAMLARYAPGTQVFARYDPDDPGFAVLEAGGDGRPYRIAAFAIGVATLIALAVTLLTRP